jgi:hypothetical protein
MFIRKVNLGMVTMSEVAPVWDVYLNESFWTPISNTSWVTDHWYQFGIDIMILQVNGSWYTDFRPSQIRITGYNPATQAWNILLQDSGLNTIATISMPPQDTTTTTPYALILTFDDLPLVDSSIESNVISNNNVTITPTNAKWDDAGRFDTSLSAYLSMPTGDHFDWGSNTWTVHFWMYTHSVPNDAGIWSNGLNVALTQGINLCFGTGGSSTLRMYLGGTGYIIQTTDGFSGGPHHVAVVNDGSYIRVYKNGIEVLYSLGPHDSSSMTIVTPTTDFVIGRFYSNSAGFYMNTTIDEFVVANEALWTGPFTPPSSPTTTTTTTSTTITADISFGALDIFRFYNTQGVFNGTQTNIEFLHY